MCCVYNIYIYIHQYWSYLSYPAYKKGKKRYLIMIIVKKIINYHHDIKYLMPSA